MKVINGTIEIHNNEQKISVVSAELFDTVRHFPADKVYVKGVHPGQNEILIELIKEATN